MELYKLRMTKNLMQMVCPIGKMQSFIRNKIPKVLHVRLVKGVMTEKTYEKWLNDYRRQYGIVVDMEWDQEECGESVCSGSFARKG